MNGIKPDELDTLLAAEPLRPVPAGFRWTLDRRVRATYLLMQEQGRFRKTWLILFLLAAVTISAGLELFHLTHATEKGEFFQIPGLWGFIAYIESALGLAWIWVFASMATLSVIIGGLIGLLSSSPPPHAQFDNNR